MDRRDSHLGLVLAGWVLAFHLPVGGLVAGFLLVERRPGHAAGIIAASVVTTLLLMWVIVMRL